VRLAGTRPLPAPGRWQAGSRSCLLIGSIPELEEQTDSIFNTCTVYNPAGELVAIHRKVHLFDIDIPGGITFKESDSLTGGKSLNSFETRASVAGCPLSNGQWLTILPPLHAAFGKFGLGICYDMRFPEIAMRYGLDLLPWAVQRLTPLRLIIPYSAARQGCVAMLYPGAFNTTTGPLHWELLARARAVDNQIFVAVCSPARSSDPDSYQAVGPSSLPANSECRPDGWHHSRVTRQWGHSSLVSPMGEVLSTTDESESIVYGEVDPAALAKARAGIPVTVQRRFDVYPDVSQ
jgi:omega-amidase